MINISTWFKKLFLKDKDRCTSINCQNGKRCSEKASATTLLHLADNLHGNGQKSVRMNLCYKCLSKFSCRSIAFRNYHELIKNGHIKD